MGGEQGEGLPLHPTHLLPHAFIAEGDVAEGEVIDGQEMATVRTRLAELQSKCAQQHQVRNLVTFAFVCVFDQSSGAPQYWLQQVCVSQDAK